jgi:hypothetical protein
MDSTGRFKYKKFDKSTMADSVAQNYSNVARVNEVNHSSLDSLFKDRMSRQELEDLRRDYLNPVFKNNFMTCTIRVPSGHQRIYSFDKKERVYVKQA